MSARNNPSRHWRPVFFGAALGAAAFALVEFLGFHGRGNELLAVERALPPPLDPAFFAASAPTPAPQSQPPPAPQEAAPPAGEKNLTQFRYWKTVRCKLTAYTPGPESCGNSADGLTSIGREAWVHLAGVAADPEVLPYGSMVHIPGVGYREVDDTGSAMRASWRNDRIIHLDVRCADVDEARRFGVRQMNVDVYLRNSRP